MELSKNYIPAAVEEKWYQHWMDNKYFKSEPDDRPAFSVVIPPPNVTGVLHMGHTLNETVQDIIIRKARMSGYNACWVPGSDHASIATEAKVVDMLKREKGIDKKDLSRKEFLAYAFEWKEKYGNIIYSQIAKLGCSVDWDRVSFTMDDHYYKAVIKVFVDLYNKGLIYRGARMINWDTVAKTALSDEEVEYKDVTGKLYYIKYKIAGAEDYIVIATQRPETIMGDVAVCANPGDERYTKFKGQKVIVPLIDKEVPVIFDDYVDKDFGTGILKITPAHDINDFNIGLKHNLPVIDTLNDDGTLSEAAQIFIGEERFAARKKIVEELAAKGLLEKEEEYTTRLGYSQRTQSVVEPKISTQWFVKMREMAKPALDEVLSGNINIHPRDKFSATYKYWLENVKDWCISRQLWWGQQIPAWYDAQGNIYVAETEEEAISQQQAASRKQQSAVSNEQEAKSDEQARRNSEQEAKSNEQDVKNDEQAGSNERQASAHSSKLTAQSSRLTAQGSKLKAQSSPLTRDEDVLDTWFSSWLWPIEVFNGITEPGNKEIDYYYPTSVLVTGQDIIFFWVARMIMSGMEYMNEKPFSDVYFTGMVRDKMGRKMSKSLGNSPDLLNLIHEYGADAVRFGIMIASPAGNDLLFDEGSLEQGKHFNNKLWNALKLIQMWEAKNGGKQSQTNAQVGSNVNNTFAIEWFESRLNQARTEVNEQMTNFKLSEALKTIYSLVWDDFCSWFLEWIKPAYEKNIDSATYQKALYFFDELLHLLHPFMPFITEEIYHLLQERTEDLMVKQYSAIGEVDDTILQSGSKLKELITAIRDTRNKNQIKPKETIQLNVETAEENSYSAFQSILVKQINADAITFNEDKASSAATIVLGNDKIFIQCETEVDTESQRQRLDKDLQYHKGFLIAVEKKLSNDKFVQNAKPEVIELERKKKADAEAKIKLIEHSLSSL